MKKSNEIPGFLPEDYDKEPPGIGDREISPEEMRFLHHTQKEEEDSKALENQMSAEYESFIVIGVKKEQYNENGRRIPGGTVKACRIDSSDLDVTSEMSRILGYYAYKYPELERAVENVEKWIKSYEKEAEEPKGHNEFPRNERFHLNRYNRILSEEGNKMSEELLNACGNYKLRRDMQMRLVLTAIADQLNNNEEVQEDFFCNFYLSERSDGDDINDITVKRRDYQCTWPEADNSRDHFVELCKQYNVPCIVQFGEI